MQLNDSASPFPLTGVRADPFDLLDLASNLIVEAMQTAAHRRVRTADVPGLLHEIATHVEHGWTAAATIFRCIIWPPGCARVRTSPSTRR